jgi:hypothetical protein
MHTTLATALLAGLIINLADIAITLMFAAKPWNEVLRGQGIAPSMLTPPYYIMANFIGAAILVVLYTTLAATSMSGPSAAFLASTSIWFVSRLYGGGHVVMRQMPLWLFAVMSAGLGLGYVLAGQFVFRWLR